MTSNGYLATPEVIREMKECGIESVQISLDGPPDLHNRTRFVPGKNGATFDRILDNILSLQDASIEVRLRINTLSKDRRPLEELVDRFKDKNIRGADFHLGHLYPLTSQVARFPGSEYLSFEEFLALNHWFLCYKIEQGLEPDFTEYFPQTSKLCRLCGANLYNQLVVGPAGDLYKCYISLGDKRQCCGNICTKYSGNNDHSRMRELEWVEWSPLGRETCRQCVYLPLCLGSCRYRQSHHGEDPHGFPTAPAARLCRHGS